MRLALRVIARRVVGLAFLFAAFEALGYAATGSWDPVTFYREAHLAVVVLLSVLAVWILVSLLVVVLSTPGEIRSMRHYEEITAVARSHAGAFTGALERALELDGRERASVLADVAVAQAQAGHDGASLTTLAVAAETAAQIRGKSGVEALASVGATLAWTGQAEASRAMLAAALEAAQKLRTTGALTIGMPLEQADALQTIAGAQADAGDFAAALDTASSIPYDDVRARALAAIGVAQARAGTSEQSQATFAAAHDAVARHAAELATSVQSPLRWDRGRTPAETRAAIAAAQERARDEAVVVAALPVLAETSVPTFARSEGMRPVSSRDELRDPVECTVFSPPAVPQEESFLVQVFAHTAEQVAEARARAGEFDEEATERGHSNLRVDIARGTDLHFELTMSDFEIDISRRSLRWDGRAHGVSFGVTAPPGRRPGNALGLVVVRAGGLPVGEISFKVEIVEPVAGPAATTPVPVGEAHAYELTFVSYARRDNKKVSYCVQVMETYGVRFFQDVLHIPRGALWEEQLYQYIEQCDCFLLFWSKEARKSEWVRKEVGRALARKGEADLDPPAIQPIIIDGPPVPRPWDELSRIQLDDSKIYRPPRAGFLSRFRRAA